jgi:hypothetical protein
VKARVMVTVSARARGEGERREGEGKDKREGGKLERERAASGVGKMERLGSVRGFPGDEMSSVLV